MSCLFSCRVNGSNWTGAVTAPVSEVKNADVAIVIGARPTQNHPVAATFIKNAVKKNGLKTYNNGSKRTRFIKNC